MSENFMLSTAVQDVFVILMLALTLVVMARNLRAISYVGVSRQLGLIAAGMAIWGGFHLVHLLFLLMGPLWLGDAQLLQVSGVMQTWVRWACESLATVLFLLGVVQLTWRFGRLMQALEESRSAYENEHNARTSLESELKTAATTQRTSSLQESEFLLGLSHELRTPLNGIIGLGSLLGNTKLDPAQRKLLGTLEESAQTMLARVAAVIDLSRLRTEKVEIRQQVFSPAELVKSVEALFLPTARKKGITLSSQATEAASAQVIGDFRLTKQLLSTLASIAIKYSSAGTVGIIVDLEPAVNDVAWVEFTCRATELRFPADTINQVRAEMGSLRGDGGIGLAICLQLASVMDGTLDLDSTAEAGTVVTVRLPVRCEV